MKIAKELRALPVTELVQRKEEFQKELLKLNVQVASGANPKNAGKIRQLRKSLAIVETLCREKSIKDAQSIKNTQPIKDAQPIEKKTRKIKNFESHKIK